MSVKNSNKKNVTIQNTPTIEEQFKKKTHHEHILDPSTADSYIGSVNLDTMDIYVYDKNENKIIKKERQIVLGLYKIFDEILVNAADNTVRDKKCNKIEVNIDSEKGEISVKNNGSTIPIEIHKEYNIYVPELIFGNLLTSGNYDKKGKIVGGKNGYGAKCIGIDTLVPLYDGSIKKASEINIGDKLIGDDGNERNVINIIRGKSKMYEITQTDGEKYLVNDNHTLTLQMPNHKNIYWNNEEKGWSVSWWDNKEKKIANKIVKILNDDINPSENNKIAKSELENFCNTIDDNNIFDIDINDYINLDKSIQKNLEGVRSKCVNWNKKKVLLDPYVLGLWLGDCIHDKHNSLFADNDRELIEYLKKWGKNNNPMMRILTDYNLIDNKHIPKDYLINDKETRLKVLAGLVDAKGKVNRNGTEIVIEQEIIHEQLTKDIIYMVRSLGLNCSYIIKTNCMTLVDKIEKFKVYNIYISGNDIQHIPTLLARKKCSNLLTNNLINSTGTIDIKDIGIGEYIGIEIDSNNRFIINDFTVTHNCANIYSTKFDVEICDSSRKKKYFQRFTNNMYKKDDPIITQIDKNEESYTKISFIPDYEKFGLKKLTKDMIELLEKRVFDIAGTTNENVNVWLNGVKLNIKSFKDYIAMYYNSDEMPNMIYEEFNHRWTLGVLFDSNAGFQHMSFVNNICTFKGGTHLNYISEQIVKKVIDHIVSQPKYKTLKIRPHQIKDNLTIFINSVIEDPLFGSQSKEELTTKSSSFKIKCDLDDKFIGKICKTGLINEIVQIAQIKQMDELVKSDGKKKTNLKSITKLDDAREAGGKNSTKCRLILTEGDSAKTFAISGLEIIGREFFGVFPLKGKLLNVRDATPNQLSTNEELKNLKQILGLKQNTIYTDTKKLRYGGIIILTDADVDGSHIKGLLINFFHYFWPDLLKIDGFIQSIATPIVKVYKNSDTKKKNPEIFYNLTEYKKWCEKQDGDIDKKFKIKYFKGLGTSTAIEAKESFNDFEKNIINYIWGLNNSSNSNKLIQEINNDPYNNCDTLDISNSHNSLNSNDSDNSNNSCHSNNSDNSDNSNNSNDSNPNNDDDISSKKTKKTNKTNKTNKKVLLNDDLLSTCSENIDKNDMSYQAITLAFAKNRSNDRKSWVKQRDENLIIDTSIKKIPIYDFVNKDLIHFSHEDNLRSIPDLIDGLKPSQRKILYGAFKRKLDNEEIKVAQLSGYISEHTGYHHGEASLQGAIINMAQNYCGSNNINLLYPSGNFGTRRLGGKDSASPRYIFTQLTSLTRNIFITKDEFVLENVIEEGEVVEPVRYYPIIPMILVNGSEGIGTGYSTNIPPFNPLDIISNIKQCLRGENDILKWKELVPWFSGFTGKIDKLVDKKNQVKYISHGKYEQLDENILRITELPVGLWTQSYIDFLSKLVEDNNMITDYENNCGNHKIDFKLTFSNGELQKLIKTNNIEEKLKLTSSVQISNMHVYKNNEIVKFTNPNQMIKDYVDIRLEIYQKRKDYWIKVLENELKLLKFRRKFIKEVISGELIISKKQKQVLIDELTNKNYPELSTNVNSKPSYDYLVGMQMWTLTQEKIDELETNYNNKKTELEKYSNTSIQDLWMSELEELEKLYIKWEQDKINELNETISIDKNKKNKKKESDNKSNESKTIKKNKSNKSNKSIKSNKSNTNFK